MSVNRRPNRVECNICSWKGIEFLPKNGRKGVKCPNCGSYERQRHQKYTCDTFGVSNRIPEYTVLHVGAKTCETRLLNMARYYVQLDLRYDRADILASIAAIPFPDASFDMIWLSHVLEHIRPVRLVLREIYRILTETGIAIIDVPMYGKSTLELMTPDHQGHFWHPGIDWPELYKQEGFNPILSWAEDCPRKEIGLLAGSLVALCKKR